MNCYFINYKAQTFHTLLRCKKKILGYSFFVLIFLMSHCALANVERIFAKAASWEAFGAYDDKRRPFCGMHFRQTVPVLRITYNPSVPGIQFSLLSDIFMVPKDQNISLSLKFDNLPQWSLSAVRESDIAPLWSVFAIEDDSASEFFSQLTRSQFLWIEISNQNNKKYKIGLRGSLFIFDRFQECSKYIINFDQ